MICPSRETAIWRAEQREGLQVRGPGAHLAGREVLLLTVPIPERRGWMSINLPASKINREKFYLRGVWLLPFCLTPSPGTHAGWGGGIWEEATE